MVHLFPTISLLFLNLLLLINYVSYCYTSNNLSPSLLHFYLRTTFNLNITLPLSTPLPFYFGSSYPHSIIINLLFSLPFYIYFSTQKNYFSLSLSLSLSLSCFFCDFFFFWEKRVDAIWFYYFKLLSFFYFLWLLNVILLHKKIMYKNTMLFYYIEWLG